MGGLPPATPLPLTLALADNNSRVVVAVLELPLPPPLPGILPFGPIAETWLLASDVCAEDEVVEEGVEEEDEGVDDKD